MASGCSTDSLIKPKYINKIIGSWIPVVLTGFTGSSGVITTDLTTVLLTAGFGANPIPLVVSPDEVSQGIITLAPSNRVEIWSNLIKEKLSSSNKEVYGRITELAGVYTLSLYTLQSGVETVYSLPSPTDLLIEFPYRFKFKDLSSDFAINLQTRNVNNDISSNAATPTTFVTSTTLNQSQILNLNSTPIELIPTPGVGKAIDIVDVTLNYTYDTADFATNTLLRIENNGATQPQFRDSIITGGINSIIKMSHYNASAAADQITENTNIVASIQSGNPTGGGTGSIIKLSILYRVIDL